MEKQTPSITTERENDSLPNKLKNFDLLIFEDLLNIIMTRYNCVKTTPYFIKKECAQHLYRCLYYIIEDQEKLLEGQWHCNYVTEIMPLKSSFYNLIIDTCFMPFISLDNNYDVEAQKDAIRRIVKCRLYVARPSRHDMMMYELETYFYGAC